MSYDEFRPGLVIADLENWPLDQPLFEGPTEEITTSTPIPESLDATRAELEAVVCQKRADCSELQLAQRIGFDNMNPLKTADIVENCAYNQTRMCPIAEKCIQFTARGAI